MYVQQWRYLSDTLNCREAAVSVQSSTLMPILVSAACDVFRAAMLNGNSLVSILVQASLTICEGVDMQDSAAFTAITLLSGP